MYSSFWMVWDTIWEMMLAGIDPAWSEWRYLLRLFSSTVLVMYTFFNRSKTGKWICNLQCFTGLDRWNLVCSLTKALALALKDHSRQKLTWHRHSTNHWLLSDTHYIINGGPRIEKRYNPEFRGFPRHQGPLGPEEETSDLDCLTKACPKPWKHGSRRLGLNGRLYKPQKRNHQLKPSGCRAVGSRYFSIHHQLQIHIPGPSKWPLWSL